MGAFLRSVSDYPMHIDISNLPLRRVSIVVSVVVVVVVVNVLFVPDRTNNRESRAVIQRPHILFKFELKLLHTFQSKSILRL